MRYGSTTSRQMLPMQFNHRGDTGHPSPADWPWRDVGSGDWYDHAAGSLRTPERARSFDSQCAGCHFTGFSLAGSESTGWAAQAVSDPGGTFDWDGDGRLEELNVGCEACHGPASEHLESTVRGDAIVSPGLLTPGRQMQICASCHSAPRGVGGGGSLAPLSAIGLMPRPGLRRAEVLRDYTSRIDAAPGDYHASGDSSGIHQQATDFVRSTMYRNGRELMTCMSCHDPHGSDLPHELELPPTDNAACTSCHFDSQFLEVRPHAETVTGFDHAGVERGRFFCVDCHMVDTVVGGARIPQLVDAEGGRPVSYFHGDTSSHRFTVPGLDVAAEQPSAATNRCAICHIDLLPNP
ncbi:MAG: hypothetical protein IT379_21680 [Deltaproteobacteria bacterium]|nr:hypothetical protein [Deltaproteobacteria bacterium]